MTDDNGDEMPPQEVFSSSCGYRDSSKGTKEVSVFIADYKLALPKHKILINPNDIIEVTDYVKTFNGTVVKSAVYNLGANIWFNEIKN